MLKKKDSNSLGSPASGATKSYVSAAAAIALYVIATFSSARSQVPAGCDSISGPPPFDFSQPLNLGLIKQQLVYYRCTKYDDDIAAVLAEAREWVEKRAPQVTKPAIVLDIDETSLSNWTEIYNNDFAYIPNGPCDLDKRGEACGHLAWQKSAQAPAIKPTLDLFDFAKCKKGVGPATCKKMAVFFITGRYQSADTENWTDQNLSNTGYHEWDGLYMRDQSTGRQSVSNHKIAARMDIELHGFTIIANIGDQSSDLIGAHAERKFKVPNPFYFIP
jgi:predicted secreted acid phosphatase